MNRAGASTARASVFVIAAFASMACGSGSAGSRSQADLEPVNTPASLVVEVGTGEVDFVELSDGAQVEMTFGTQGGYHIWTSVRIRDVTVELVQINVSTRFEVGGAAAGPASRWPAELDLRDGARVHVGMRNFIERAPEVVGKRIILRAEVSLETDGTAPASAL